MTVSRNDVFNRKAKKWRQIYDNAQLKDIATMTLRGKNIYVMCNHNGKGHLIKGTPK